MNRQVSPEKILKCITSRNIATEACENSPAMFTSMASEQNVHGAEVVSPDNDPHYRGGTMCEGGGGHSPPKF